jgi:hypothetical protein
MPFSLKPVNKSNDSFTEPFMFCLFGYLGISHMMFKVKLINQFAVPVVCQ